MRNRLCVIVLAAACGGGDSGGSPVAITDLGMKLSVAECAKAFRCCTQEELSALFESTTKLTTTDQCDQYLGGLLNNIAIPHFMSSIAAGRVSYDADAAGACVASIGGMSCAQFDMTTAPTAPSGCMDFVTPLVALGGACSQSYECIDSYCKGAVTLPTPMDGTCTTRPALGQACTSLCATGLYCDQTVMKCATLKPDGTQCTVGTECSSGGCATGQCGPICG